MNSFIEHRYNYYHSTLRNLILFLKKKITSHYIPSNFYKYKIITKQLLPINNDHFNIIFHDSFEENLYLNNSDSSYENGKILLISNFSLLSFNLSCNFSH